MLALGDAGFTEKFALKDAIVGMIALYGSMMSGSKYVETMLSLNGFVDTSGEVWCEVQEPAGVIYEESAGSVGSSGGGALKGSN